MEFFCLGGNLTWGSNDMEHCRLLMGTIPFAQGTQLRFMIVQQFVEMGISD